jgi:acyl-coenzyme A synthetase/AMP-(fatty) acid ligase
MVSGVIPAVALREAYFDVFPGVWRHGDWVTITDHGSCVITGRSDATLNRGGVRLGTAEFYSVVESLDEVVDSVVVHLEDAEGGAGELLLFVVLADGVTLDDAPRPIARAAHRPVAAASRTISRCASVPARCRKEAGGW